MPTLRTATLGCKVNQYETELVRQGLASIGYRDAAADEHADLCVVNTCTVTHEGDAKSRQTIRRLAKRNPGARIIVMGCYATRAPQEVGATARRQRSHHRQARAAGFARAVWRDRSADGHLDVCRSSAGVHQSAGRLYAAVQLLHYSAGAAARCEPAAGTYRRRSPPALRQRISRVRAHGDSPGALWRGVEPRPAEV